MLALQFTSFALPSLRVRSFTRSVYAYGYLGAWAAEGFYGPDMKEIGQELLELQKLSPDRLEGVEEPWPVTGHVVIVQMESIGWSVLNARIAGQAVAPYLSGLAASNRCFRIQAYHAVGSEDMDYAVLSGGTPSSRMVSYDVPGVTYSNALPGFMQQHGFHTVALHGNDGGFFNRRSNFDRMGFDEIRFKEDFTDPAVKRDSWGVRDAELFQFSSREIRQAAGPQFHFIITLDSHAPFNLIDDQEKQVFPNTSDWRENYFNSARLLACCGITSARSRREHSSSFTATTRREWITVISIPRAKGALNLSPVLFMPAALQTLLPPTRPSLMICVSTILSISCATRLRPGPGRRCNPAPDRTKPRPARCATN